ncbi:hypothetical protein DXA36_06875 [Eisenbergiella sp. OF01-20]|nr:hypothetical protein DXA36_06875 [Eisenbergiella sp. OF01-20]
MDGGVPPPFFIIEHSGLAVTSPPPDIFSPEDIVIIKIGALRGKYPEERPNPPLPFILSGWVSKWLMRPFLFLRATAMFA